MLDMPVIPGLGAGTPEPLSLTELLDSMSEQEVADLAAELTGGGEEEATESPADEDAEEAEEPAAEEAAEGPDDAAAEAAEEGEENPAVNKAQQLLDRMNNVQELKGQIDTARTEGESILAELNNLLDQAEENADAGGQPKEVEKAVSEAEKLLADLTDHADAVDESVAADDAEAAATSGMQALECVQKMEGLLTKAKASAAANTSAEAPSDENPTPALGVWADSYLNR